MATLLYRLGRASFRRRRLVVVLWLVLLAALGGAALAFKGPTSSNFTMPGTESQRAIDSLRQEFPEGAGAVGLIVVAAPEGRTLTDGPLTAAVKQLVAEAKELPGVVGARRPVREQGHFPGPPVRADPGPVRRAAPTSSPRRSGPRTRTAVRAPRQAGLRVGHGGEVMNSAPEVGGTEAHRRGHRPRRPGRHLRLAGRGRHDDAQRADRRRGGHGRAVRAEQRGRADQHRTGAGADARPGGRHRLLAVHHLPAPPAPRRGDRHRRRRRPGRSAPPVRRSSSPASPWSSRWPGWPSSASRS